MRSAFVDTGWHTSPYDRGYLNAISSEVGVNFYYSDRMFSKEQIGTPNEETNWFLFKISGSTVWRITGF